MVWSRKLLIEFDFKIKGLRFDASYLHVFETQWKWSWSRGGVSYQKMVGPPCVTVIYHRLSMSKLNYFVNSLCKKWGGRCHYIGIINSYDRTLTGTSKAEHALMFLKFFWVKIFTKGNGICLTWPLQHC